MRSWSFCIKSSVLMPSLAIDNLRRACPCRETAIGASRGTSLFRASPATRTTTDKSANCRCFRPATYQGEYPR
jgi:hypothetical protein